MSRLTKWFIIVSVIILGAFNYVLPAFLGVAVITISNYEFMIGLGLILIAAILILKDGHLFASWSFFAKQRAKVRNDSDHTKSQIQAISDKKHQPIKIKFLAKMLLILGILLIFNAITITL